MLDEYNREEAERKRRAQEFAEGEIGTSETYRFGNDTLYVGNEVETTGLFSSEIRALEKACRASGKKVIKPRGGCVFSDGSIRRDIINCRAHGAEPLPASSHRTFLACVKEVGGD